MLETENVSVFYGSHHALDGASITVDKNEIVVMLGANGAGKSTFLRAIAGLTPAAPSSIIKMDGIEITGQTPDDIVEAGIATVPEDRGIFADLSVRENLVLGAYAERARQHEAKNLDRVMTLFPRLAERQNQAVRTMSGGERQMVAIGRAMMSHPSILMLDEPSLGLSPILCTELFRSLTAVRDTGVGIFLVEQNAKQSLTIADRGYLLENGRISGANTAEALARDEAVINAYLGGGTKTRAPTPAPAHAPAPAMATASSPARGNRGGERATAPQAITPTAITPGGLADAKPSVEEILPESIDDMVAHATNVSVGHVHGDGSYGSETVVAPTPQPQSQPEPPRKHNGSGAPAHRVIPDNPKASTELRVMLASFEQAAADALSGKTRPADTGLGDGGEDKGEH